MFGAATAIGGMTIGCNRMFSCRSASGASGSGGTGSGALTASEPLSRLRSGKRYGTSSGGGPTTFSASKAVKRFEYELSLSVAGSGAGAGGSGSGSGAAAAVFAGETDAVVGSGGVVGSSIAVETGGVDRFRTFQV